jgi:SAM-dependent methyltransferase
MSLLGRLADIREPGSAASALRRRRVHFLLDLLHDVPPPVRLLDVGGTPQFWKGHLPLPGTAITVLNLALGPDVAGVTQVAGDARDMRGFGEGSFDVVFSNSVIEHVGGPGDQARMAREVARVGRRWVVQTPNRMFPVEPHFLAPFFQFLPRRLKLLLVRWRRMGWYARARTAAEAAGFVDGVRLLRASDLALMFPQCMLVEEGVLGLAKSFMACFGWPEEKLREAAAHHGLAVAPRRMP